MRKILYLGTDPSHFVADGEIVHCPLIQIAPRPKSDPALQKAFSQIEQFTHILFTSKNCVRIFFTHCAPEHLLNKQLIAIGAVTAHTLRVLQLSVSHCSQEETQEGMITLLKTLDLSQAYCFLPRSSLSRPLLLDYLQNENIRVLSCDLYDTLPRIPENKPDLNQIDEIIFTSPSTVHAFLQLFGALPENKILRAIGPITQAALEKNSKLRV